MHHAFGLDIPRTLEDACTPQRCALIVYDMQIGIIRQIKNGAEITAKVARWCASRARRACASCSCGTCRCRAN